MAVCAIDGGGERTRLRFALLTNRNGRDGMSHRARGLWL
jgi:hypothetical protein